MRPRERRDSGQNDLFKGRLDQIVDMNRPLMKLARTIDWDFLETSFGAVYSDGAGSAAASSSERSTRSSFATSFRSSARR